MVGTNRPNVRKDIGAVWFVAKRATLCLRLVVRIEELTLGRKVWQFSHQTKQAYSLCLSA
jgi:hypothetical protein